MLDRVRNASKMFTDLDAVSKELHHQMFDLIHALGAEVRFRDAKVKELRAENADLKDQVQAMMEGRKEK